MNVIPESTVPDSARRGARDPGRYAGIGFAVAFAAAVTLWGLGPSTYGSDFDTFAADSAARTSRSTSLALSHVLMPLASLFLLWTVARMRRALDAAAGRPSVAGQVAFGLATVLAVGFCLLAAAAHVSALVAGGGYIEGFPPQPAVGYGLALLGGYFGNATVWGASGLLVVVGAASWRARLIPHWLIWVGYLTAPLLIVGWYYGIPVLLLCLWVAVTGLTMQTDRV